MSDNGFSLTLLDLSLDDVNKLISIRIAFAEKDEEKLRTLLGDEFFKVIESPFGKRADADVCKFYLDLCASKDKFKSYIKHFEAAVIHFELFNDMRSKKSPLWLGRSKADKWLAEITPSEFSVSTDNAKKWKATLDYSCGDEAPIKMFLLAQAFYNSGWKAEPRLSMGCS